MQKMQVICNTSPFQYLHQIDQLHLLPALCGKVIVPPAVVKEIEAGHSEAVDLPDFSRLDWLIQRTPAGQSALPLIADLGAGESEVLMLGLEIPGATVILDDMLARRVAESLKLSLSKKKIFRSMSSPSTQSVSSALKKTASKNRHSV